MEEVTASKYPFVLAHGIMLKDIKFFKAFGRIEKTLKKQGYKVYTSATDGFGTVENNAAQLKNQIEGILKAENVEKVNIIAHSKGGLDAVYMLKNLGMEEKVASLTTLCTPHKGSHFASQILKLPDFIKNFIAFWLNFWYRIFGDEKPDALAVCKELKAVPDMEEQIFAFSEKVYCQSFSTAIKRGRDDFIMGIPMWFTKKLDKQPSDGLVYEDSTKFGTYRGSCTDAAVSHSQMVDFMAGKKKREKIYAFYVNLCRELAEMGF